MERHLQRFFCLKLAKYSIAVFMSLNLVLKTLTDLQRSFDIWKTDLDAAEQPGRKYGENEPADAGPLIQNSGLPAKYPSFKVMLELINNCSQLELPVHKVASSIATNQSEPNNTISKWSPWALWNGIVPGTKWCGVGDIASTFEELGSQAVVDSCCRAHDHCPVKLKAFRVGYGMINLSFYTKSHCDCDRLFYSCLKRTKNKLADAVGNFYFNFIRVQCLKERKVYVCVENRTDVDGLNECIRWSVDPDSRKMESIVTDLKY